MHPEQPRRAWPLERAALAGIPVIASALSFPGLEAVPHAANWGVLPGAARDDRLTCGQPDPHASACIRAHEKSRPTRPLWSGGAAKPRRCRRTNTYTCKTCGAVTLMPTCTDPGAVVGWDRVPQALTGRGVLLSPGDHPRREPTAARCYRSRQSQERCS